MAGVGWATLSPSGWTCATVSASSGWPDGPTPTRTPTRTGWWMRRTRPARWSRWPDDSYWRASKAVKLRLSGFCGFSRSAARTPFARARLRSAGVSRVRAGAQVAREPEVEKPHKPHKPQGQMAF